MSTFLFHFVDYQSHTLTLTEGHYVLDRYAGWIIPLEIIGCIIVKIAINVSGKLSELRPPMETGADSLVDVLLPCLLALSFYLNILPHRSDRKNLNRFKAGQLVLLLVLPRPKYVLAVLGEPETR